MSKNFTLKPKEIDANLVRYSDLKKMSSGAKIAYVNYGKEGINSIFMETPEATFPFDNTFYPDQDGKGGKYSCKISLKGDSKEMEEFIVSMTKLDEKIKEDAKKNCQAWFGKKSISDEVIEEKYTPIVRHYKDPESGELTGKFPAQMGFKIVQRDNVFQCKFYDESRKRLNVDSKDEDDYVETSNLLSKGNSAKLLLKCNGMWFSTAGFGCTWKAEQVKVKVPEQLDDYAFREEDDTFVEDSDDGDDGDDGDDDGESDSGSGSEGDETVKVVKRKA
tara:strand:- start:22 stop:849 length:828 start_codon:yes stop_codon:yes gene_type:complete